ncbi:hypothetical protein ACEPAH_1765 [Sanghuangporus vaninii]
MLALPLFAIATVFSTRVPSTHAHGYVQEVVADGTTYTGYLPYEDPYKNPVPDRIIRKIPGNGPVEDVTLIDIQCNGESDNGTEPAALFATIEAGSQLQLNWTAWPDSHVGPVITYLAAVPDGTDVTAYSPGTDSVWFKIDEAGKNDQGEWAATDGLYATNSVYSVTIPESLRPGQYIVRHEIIALHQSYSYPGSQFYPSCIQIEVTGCGDAFPTDDFFVSFPGAYTPDTPGIVYNVYTNTSAYPIPGPAVFVAISSAFFPQF